MKHLKSLCTPRKIEKDTDVLDIIDLAEGRIDPALFLRLITKLREWQCC